GRRRQGELPDLQAAEGRHGPDGPYRRGGGRLAQIAFELRREGEAKICSLESATNSAIRKASGSEGSYLPVSIALTLWRETSSRLARSCWLHARSRRRLRSRLSMTSKLYTIPSECKAYATIRALRRGKYRKAHPARRA